MFIQCIHTLLGLLGRQNYKKKTFLSFVFPKHRRTDFLKTLCRIYRRKKKMSRGATSTNTQAAIGTGIMLATAAASQNNDAEVYFITNCIFMTQQVNIITPQRIKRMENVRAAGCVFFIIANPGRWKVVGRRPLGTLTAPAFAHR